jgi:aspartyl-tRNA(Asn)/glutamyl-tRNA(Gln) amidotransferase subunit A
MAMANDTSARLAQSLTAALWNDAPLRHGVRPVSEDRQSPSAAGSPYASISEMGERIRRQEVSPVDVVRASLQRIEKLNPSLNAFITVLAEDALARAGIAEAEIKAGQWRGPLHGLPVGVKDMFDTAGVRTTAAFEHFRNRTPQRDAVAVSKLRQAGAIIIGKTNMHRLAMGTTSAVSNFGPVRNPWNRSFIAGGSSGGSAAAIASGMCFATLDTDAIGSCRLPASCCGVTGFKGAYGLISNKGVLEGEQADAALLWLAHAAFTTRSAEDAALVLNVLAEPSAKTNQSADYFAALTQDEQPRIGVAANFSASAAIASAFGDAVEIIRQFGPVREAAAPLDNPGFDVRNIEADRRTIAESLFSDIDILALPTTEAPIPMIDGALANPMALSARNTLFANYYGLPAITIPCGFDDAGLPLGFQLVGKPGGEATALALAHRYQQATPWSRMHPID